MPLPIEGLFEGNGNQEDTKFVRVEHRNRKIHPNVNSGNILNLAPYNLNTKYITLNTLTDFIDYVTHHGTFIYTSNVLY